MDCTVHGILQDRMLKWVVFPFSSGSSQPRDQSQISRIAGRFFTSWATREAQEYWSGQLIVSPVDLADPGIEPGSPILQADPLPTELSGKPSFRDRGSRWWHGRILSSPPPMNAVNLQLHMEQSPLKTSWAPSSHCKVRKKSHWGGENRLRYSLTTNSSSGAQTKNGEGTHKPEFFALF